MTQVDAGAKRSEFVLWALEVKKKDPHCAFTFDVHFTLHAPTLVTQVDAGAKRSEFVLCLCGHWR